MSMAPPPPSPDEAPRGRRRQLRIERPDFRDARDLTTLFRDAQIHELEQNAHKGSWSNRSDREHFSDLDYHCDKLKAAVRSGADNTRILEFAADVSNHALFIAQDRGALLRIVLDRRAREPEYVRPPARFWLSMLRYPRSYWAALVAWLNPARLGYKPKQPRDTVRY